MPTPTLADARPRFVMRRSPAPVHNRYLAAARSPAGGPCSPAGWQRRPWLARLRRALAQELFVLHRQPIVSLRDGTVSHYEALLRLADEGSGRLVAPGAFLPAAERYGLIADIDRMVLSRVIALLSDERHASIAVNLSAQSVTDSGMLADIAHLLERWRIDPARLVIELTETSAISDMRRAKAFCSGARALGCAVALDDFGAGFGSFGYLKHLPFDYLKIDGDFIRALRRSPTDQLVVRALAWVVTGLGRRTIAEFVGDRATMGLLGDYGVDYAQGYYLGHPRPFAPAA
jgi:EAL domain-containing protein (putative c-di-GMP-specific phosphodiesterase class I)